MSAGISFSDIQLARPLALHTVLRQRNAVGGVTVPVNPSLGYVRFKHVRGVPAHNQPGLSLDKVKMIDNLLERLSQDPKFTNTTGTAPLDQQVMELAKQLHDKAERFNPPAYAPVTPNDANLLFSVTA